MARHTLAIVLFAGLLFQVGCSFGVERDKRPWTAARYGSLAGGVCVLSAALWLAVDAL